jgi:hypothetical protein
MSLRDLPWNGVPSRRFTKTHIYYQNYTSIVEAISLGISGSLGFAVERGSFTEIPKDP